MDTTPTTQKIISFCTGLRGIERGLIRSGVPIREICFVEIEAVICENLVAQMEAGLLDSAPVWTDLKTFPAEKFRGLVDGIIGGYPCTPFSLAGLRLGSADERHLWPFIRTHVEAIRPLWCFFENVDDHLTLGFDTVYKDLRSLGYAVEAGVFSAAESGAPHERQRVFILAYASRKSTGKQNNQTNAISGKEWSRQIFSSGSTQLADPRYVRSEKRQEQSGRVIKCNKVADTIHNRRPPGQGTIPSQGEATQGEEYREEWDKILRQWCRSKPWDGCPVVANTNIWRPQPRQSSGMGRERKQVAVCNPMWQRWQRWQSIKTDHKSEFPTIERADSLWPSGPGQPQYDWEHPRTLTREAESAMGLSTHGYNFREDILRALGNSVVEQQAEIAWTTLWNKINSPSSASFHRAPTR